MHILTQFLLYDPFGRESWSLLFFSMGTLMFVIGLIDYMVHAELQRAESASNFLPDHFIITSYGTI